MVIDFDRIDSFQTALFFKMPFTIELNEEEMERLEKDGGLATDTLKDRDRCYFLFHQYYEKEAEGIKIEEMLTEDGKKDFDKFGKIFNR